MVLKNPLSSLPPGRLDYPHFRQGAATFLELDP